MAKGNLTTEADQNIEPAAHRGGQCDERQHQQAIAAQGEREHRGDNRQQGQQPRY